MFGPLVVVFIWGQFQQTSARGLRTASRATGNWVNGCLCNYARAPGGPDDLQRPMEIRVQKNDSVCRYPNAARRLAFSLRAKMRSVGESTFSSTEWQIDKLRRISISLSKRQILEKTLSVRCSLVSCRQDKINSNSPVIRKTTTRRVAIVNMALRGMQA